MPDEPEVPPSDETPPPGPDTPDGALVPGAESDRARAGQILIQRRRGPLALAVPIIGLIALVGAAVFAATSLSGNKGGGATPEEAVRNFFEAVASEDVLGVMENLVPAERDALRGPVTDLTVELKRLDILTKNFDLSNVSGIDLSFDDLKLSTHTLGEGVAAVTLAGGTVRYRVDKAALPLGRFVRDLAGEALFGPIVTDSEPITTEDYDDPVVAVREKDRWYMSLMYSIAEGARRDAGGPLPDFGKGLQAEGASSPEAAVEAAMQALSRFDLRTLLGLLPPDEARALHDYSTLFIGTAAAGLLEIQERADVKITRLELGSERTGDEALVTVERFGFTVTGREPRFTLKYDGDCLTSEGLGEFFPPRLCGDELKGGAGLPAGKNSKIGFITVERNGVWYISPIRTMLRGTTAMLKVMTPKDLEQLKEFLGGLTSEA